MIASGNILCKVAVATTQPQQNKYISGHVSDNSNSINFVVNANQLITVQVDANGDFTWNADRDVYSFVRCFKNVLNISNVEIVGFNKFSDLTEMFYCNSPNDTLKSITFTNCNFINVTSFTYAFNQRRGLQQLNGIANTPNKSSSFYYSFYNCININFENINWDNLITSNASVLQTTFMWNNSQTIIDISKCDKNGNYGSIFDQCGKVVTLYLPNFDIYAQVTQYSFRNMSKLENIMIQENKQSLIFGNSNLLTKQSVINMVNAAAANVTYTLHSTVYNKCKSGGEWYTDVQAAINAKALEGYTVTLISA